MMNSKSKNIYMYILGAIIVFGFFGTLIFMISKNSYESEVNMIVGALIGSFITIVSYFYGSSKGSSDKTKIINQNNKNVK